MIKPGTLVKVRDNAVSAEGALVQSICLNEYPAHATNPIQLTFTTYANLKTVWIGAASLPIMYLGTIHMPHRYTGPDGAQWTSQKEFFIHKFLHQGVVFYKCVETFAVLEDIFRPMECVDAAN